MKLFEEAVVDALPLPTDEFRQRVLDSERAENVHRQLLSEIEAMHQMHADWTASTESTLPEISRLQPGMLSVVLTQRAVRTF